MSSPPYVSDFSELEIVFEAIRQQEEEEEEMPAQEEVPPPPPPPPQFEDEEEEEHGGLRAFLQANGAELMFRMEIEVPPPPPPPTQEDNSMRLADFLEMRREAIRRMEINPPRWAAASGRRRFF